jgi:dTDP-4-dehydrorhamnose reductase
VTEAHLGCTREEQLRWFREVWDAAREARGGGADVRAVTAWALLGSYDWNSLVTCDRGCYEPGVFDVRGPAPRPTALASMLKTLADGREYEHPVVNAPGWWRRLERFIYPPTPGRARASSKKARMLNKDRGAARPILITGATGTLGRAFARVCEARGLSYRLLSRGELDIAEPASVEAALDAFEPWAVVNAAGYVRVDDAETEAERCFRENTEGPRELAAACARRGVSLLTFSSDLVFDGAAGRPYVESDAVSPLNVYGRSKAEAERLVLGENPSALVVRTSAFFGPWDEYNFVTLMLRALSSGRRFVAASDAKVSPTYVPDLAHACLDLLIDGERGVWHLANEGAVTWAEFARKAAGAAGLDASLVEARRTSELDLRAARPAYGVLASERAQLLPALDDALSRYLRDCEVTWASVSLDGPRERARAKAAASE